MKLLFLDIDGVGWTPGGVSLARQIYKNKECRFSQELDPVAMAIIGDLVEEQDFKVIITSTWRLGHTIDKLKEMLGPRVGPRIIAVTPHLPGEERGKEIKLFLDNWNEHYYGGKVSDILILDDDRDMNPYMGYLYWTDSINGFTFRDLVNVERYLKLPPWRKKIVQIRKIVCYNVSRQFWGLYRPLTWKIERIKDKVLTLVGKLCNQAKPTAGSLPSPSQEKTSTESSSGASPASVGKQS